MNIKHTFIMGMVVFSGLTFSTKTLADEPFIGEMRYFAGNFAPRGWANCDGQVLSIANHTALFSILGTTYGGDGRTTFNLPDMRGKALGHAGNGPGLTSRSWGQSYGATTTTMSEANLPNHSHNVQVANSSATTNDPLGNAIAAERIYKNNTSTNVDMVANSIESKGGNNAINVEQPYIVVRCIIALTGIYPSRS